MTNEMDNEMTPIKKAGDKRRVLTAIVQYHEGSDIGVAAAIHEAHQCGRGHHFIKYAIELLANFLRDRPDRVDELRQEIARLILIENGDDNEGSETS